jgi:diacylglycerol kinase family enzyme
MRVDVFANATAHGFRARPALLDEARRAAEGRAGFFATRSLVELDEAARDVARRGSDLVALAGGDGTFMAGLTALARAFGEERLPAVALVPAGTVATVARNWGVRGDPARLLRAVIAAPRALCVTERPTLRVTAARAGGAREERLGFIFGTGLVAGFFDLYYADGARGLRGAAGIVARVFAGSFVGGETARRVLEPLPCRLEVDGALLAPRAFSLVCAAVVRDLGLSMKVNHRAAEDFDRPHLVASALPPRALGPRAPLVLAGRPIGGAGHFDGLTTSFTVSFDGEGPYVLDGDALRAASVRVAAGPRIRVATP